MHEIVGGDFNTQYFVRERGMLLFQLCQEFDLQICNPHEVEDNSQSWTFQSSLDARRIIDFIFCSRAFNVNNANASKFLHLESNHRSVFCDICMKQPHKKKFKKSHKQRWKLYFNEKREAEEYYKLLIDSLHPIQETSLTKARSVILTCINQCDTSHINAVNFEKS